MTAIDNPESLGSKRSSEMGGFYRFIAGRMPDLIREWEEIRKALDA